MNLILFTSAELSAPLPRRDARAVHVLSVLRRGVGGAFDAGLIDGPRGKATITAITADALSLSFAFDPAPPPPLAPLSLIVGFPRPQTARKILHAATELGVAALHFVATERCEPSYAQSTLWSSGEWRRHLIDAAQQAFDTRLPAVTHTQSLADALATLPEAASTRLALDNYESPAPLGVCHLMGDKPVILALGPERGWGPADRAALRAAHFTFAHLGPRVLRAETAVTASVALVKSKLGLM